MLKITVRIISTIFLCFFGGPLFAQQNLKLDYKPLKSEGILPELFTKPVAEKVTQGIKELTQAEDSSTKVKSELLILTNYSIDWEIKSGNSLVNEEITQYLDDIAGIILKDQPELRKNIKIFTSKSPVVNAATFYNGTVFVDLGLIAHATNEAQIAYALCHEISHYIKQHTVQDWIYLENMEKTSEGKTSEDVFKEKCQYSHEQENEADSCGFRLLKGTNYDTKESVELFNMFLGAHLPFELSEFNKSFFETENFKIPEKYIIKELAPVKDRSGEEDEDKTHPNPGKRKESISKLIDPASGGKKFILDENRFNYIRDLARFEICRLQLRYRDYNAALYSAYLLSKKYPDNLYLTQTISKCLYAISLNHTGHLRYTKDSYLDGPIHYLEVESYQQQLYYLINKLSDAEWNIMSLNYVFRKHKKFPNDKVLSALSDSLFKTMYYVNATFEVPGENKIFTNVNPNPDTTSWYKNVFTDLFTDPEFVEKFPKTIGNDFIVPYTPKSYSKNRFERKMRIVENIGKVMCLKPHYVIYDDAELQSLYLRAEEDQKNLLMAIKNCSEKQKFELVVLDPGLVDSTEVGKINDYAIVTDWLNECSDGDENEKQRVPIFSTDELNDVVNRYGTSHVLMTGFSVVNGKKSKYYVFYSVVYDLKQNRQVYIHQQSFKGKPTKADMEARICSLFDELKYGEKP